MTKADIEITPLRQSGHRGTASVGLRSNPTPEHLVLQYSRVATLSVHRGLAKRMAMGVHIRRICATVGLIVFLGVSLGCPAGFAAEPKRIWQSHPRRIGSAIPVAAGHH
jgi:hypothetical protein